LRKVSWSSEVSGGIGGGFIAVYCVLFSPAVGCGLLLPVLGLKNDKATNNPMRIMRERIGTFSESMGLLYR
jgi:hypothetical protein